MSDFLFEIGDKVKILSEAKIYRQNDLKKMDHPTLISSMIFYTGKIATIKKRIYSVDYDTNSYVLKECNQVKWREDWLEIYTENFFAAEDFII